MEKPDGKAIFDLHENHNEKARDYQESVSETELNILRFINTTIEDDKTKNNPEMVSALAGLLKEIKRDC